MITVTIDGREVQAAGGQTVLEVAREHGIHVPTLCYHEAMEPFAACRLCVVEVEAGRSRRLVASCAYPCTEGLVVYTKSDVVLQSRRTTLELLMASSAHIPMIRRLAQDLGAREPRFVMEENDCVLCGLCVRACHEVVGVGAISVVNRGIDKKVSPPFQVASDVCIGCGTCVLFCPTGAIKLADIVGGAQGVHSWRSEYQAVDCRLCGHHYLVPKFADHQALLAEAAVIPGLALSEVEGTVEEEAVR